ncbi:MAG: hypothetical protein JNJ57_03865 [Saprospiraceae bacterium]|nr:hypothetical protein [Saprospiraceae bacterium]
MKIKCFHLIFGIIAFVIFISCNESPDLTGSWYSNNRPGWQLIISKTGDTYTILQKIEGQHLSFSGKYINGIIEIGAPSIGNPTYSEDTKKITWMGEEWDKIQDIPLQKK